MFSEFGIVGREGQVCWIHAYGHALYHEEGSPQRMLGLCLEVTDLKVVADQAAQASVENKAKSTFLATMSHELRTPLNSILGFT